MADLDVQKKKSSPLPWILLVLAILAVAAFFLLNRDSEVVDDTTTPALYDSTNRTGADSLPQ